MLLTRVMPCLLLRGRGLVKTVKFRKPAYVGDPINTVRIYNDKEVDELIFLDITATAEGRAPQLELLYEIATECFMPFTYGGGVRTIEQMAELFHLGAEKVALGSAAFENPSLISAAAARFGSQAVVVSVDVRKKRFFGRGYSVYVRCGRDDTGSDPVSYAKRMEQLGAGEILLTSIDRDGTMEGYDLELVQSVTSAVGIPVVACGGAGSLDDLGRAVRAGASAAAAGSLVVYQGKNRAVLVNFPTRAQLRSVIP
jgi:cyclase